MNTDKIYNAIEDIESILETLDIIKETPINELDALIRNAKNILDDSLTQIEDEIKRYHNHKVLNEFYDLEDNHDK